MYLYGYEYIQYKCCAHALTVFMFQKGTLFMCTIHWDGNTPNIYSLLFDRQGNK